MATLHAGFAGRLGGAQLGAHASGAQLALAVAQASIGGSQLAYCAQQRGRLPLGT